MRVYLEFEKPIEEIERKIDELRQFSSENEEQIRKEVEKLRKKMVRLQEEIFSNLTPWQKTLLSRHPNRPYTMDYIAMLFEEFVELHGDRLFRDDPAIIGGLAMFNGQTVMVVGHQKGRTTKEKLHRNFGMAHPEGYRKALRLMKLAESFRKPIISFIDTPGAYPGIGAEERGQAEAIAVNLREMASLKVPIIIAVIGEGGSGGALAIGVGDRILMMEYAIYSVISPEGCASILWRDAARAPEAASAMKITAHDLMELGVIDEIVKEPLGGAHSNPEDATRNLKKAIEKHLNELMEIPFDELPLLRYKKYKAMGAFYEGNTDR